MNISHKSNHKEIEPCEVDLGGESFARGDVKRGLFELAVSGIASRVRVCAVFQQQPHQFDLTAADRLEEGTARPHA